ncbi:MAG: LytTR family DNA-binding domain-containing protein [Bacteroidales bacterium]|nr:LytTR family DNA-binding domain-containing protein [Bacteroidales bacterium]
MKINCIAVDDEPLALEKMEDYIKRVDFLNLLGLIDNGVDAINFIKQNKVDLVFLDIQMNDLSGIELLETLSVKPIIIFTTAYENYALQGYELNVTDYLLKPISFIRFLKSIDKVTEVFRTRNSLPISEHKEEHQTNEQDSIFIKSEGKMQRIVFRDILYIEAMKDYVKIWTPSGKIICLSNIKNFIEKLPASQFLRIHKSYAIALDKIEAIKQKYIEIAGQDIPIGNTYKNLLFSRLIKNGMI